MLEGKNSSSVIKEYDCELAKGETNDCVPRAIAVAYDITYEEAHKICSEKFGRQPRKGTKTLLGFMSEDNKEMVINNKKHAIIQTDEVSYTGSPRYLNEKNKEKSHEIRIVVREMVQKFPEGTYIVMVRGHAFALVNGVIIGNPEDYKKMKRKVMSLVQINNIK
tara:strand:- start:96 stop:587 length:492 start_codon:yes stop_codon:yes gene_type:complete